MIDVKYVTPVSGIGAIALGTSVATLGTALASGALVIPYVVVAAESAFLALIAGAAIPFVVVGVAVAVVGAIVTTEYFLH